MSLQLWREWHSKLFLRDLSQLGRVLHDWRGFEVAGSSDLPHFFLLLLETFLLLKCLLLALKNLFLSKLFVKLLTFHTALTARESDANRFGCFLVRLNPRSQSFALHFFQRSRLKLGAILELELFSLDCLLEFGLFFLASLDCGQVEGSE